MLKKVGKREGDWLEIGNKKDFLGNILLVFDEKSKHGDISEYDTAYFLVDLVFSLN